LGQEKFKFFLDYFDNGDFIGCEGEVFTTKKGEKTLLVKKYEMLGKALLPLPEKWHGLTDKEARYRQRYLDLIANSEVKDVFIKRQKIIDLTRVFLQKQGYLEVETPLLQPIYDGAEAEPFVTELKALRMKLFLSISPEIYLKKLLVGDLEKVFTICKNFRNEGIDRSHNPEFTMLESYAAYWDYNDVMKMTENLLQDLAQAMTGGTKVKYQDKEIDFKAPFEVLRMDEAIKKYAGIDVADEKAVKAEAKKIGAAGTHDEMANAIFEEKVESNLIQPTFVVDYPKSICPLTKEHRKNKNEVERFELFVNGMELANAYSELNDPQEQEARLKEQIKNREKNEKLKAHMEANILDEDFLTAMQHGMPPAGGLGIGIDRLVMLLTDSVSIRDVILFPFMRPHANNDANTSE
jgi:lysyl-tRNA synthetase class 2